MKKIEQVKRSGARKNEHGCRFKWEMSLGFIGKVTFEQRPERGKNLAMQVSGRIAFQSDVNTKNA